jgi:phosphoglycerate dehydrogenase-like enzyme
MKIPKIVNMSPLPSQALMGLVTVNFGITVNVVDIKGLSENGIVELIEEAEIIFGDWTFEHPLTARMAEAARNVKLVQQPSDGYNHIDLDAFARAGIPVANCSGANDIAVAEHTLMLALVLLRHLKIADSETHAGKWAQADMMWNVGVSELFEKTWGIIGLGRIGRHVARMLETFNVKKLYFDVNRQPEAVENELNARFAELPALLKACDIVSVHVPLTPENHSLFNEETFKQMKRAALFINVSRGELVDEAALAAAIKNKKLGGAGIDVFSTEPIDPANPLLGLDNVILTPHIAGTTAEARKRIIDIAVGNIARVLKGEKSINVVNGVI